MKKPSKEQVKNVVSLALGRWFFIWYLPFLAALYTYFLLGEPGDHSIPILYVWMIATFGTLGVLVQILSNARERRELAWMTSIMGIQESTIGLMTLRNQLLQRRVAELEGQLGHVESRPDDQDPQPDRDRPQDSDHELGGDHAGG